MENNYEMMIVKESIEDVLSPADDVQILNNLKKQSIEQRLYLIEDLWNENYQKFVEDFYTYFGNDKFMNWTEELIVNKYHEIY